MDTQMHTMPVLFEQLGLDGSEEAIEQFVDSHGPIPSQVELHEAVFWTPEQSRFLKQVIDEDADWAEVVDQLNTMLR